MTPKGATFEAKPAQDKVEFLATTDDWFRPVFLTHGPEGAMYVADMYRAVIEHPEFMPPELKNRPDLWAGRDKAASAASCRRTTMTKTPRPGLSKASIAELVKTLKHEEPWYRTTAQRLLLEKNDKEIIAPLRELLNSLPGQKTTPAVVLAGYMLEKVRGVLTDQEILNMLRTGPISVGHPRVREHGICLAEPRLATSEPLMERLGELYRDDDARVRFQLALSVGGLEKDSGNVLLSDMVLYPAFKDPSDRWARLAAECTSPDRIVRRPGGRCTVMLSWRG